MSFHPNTRICTHIKVNGTRCGSPALREEVFCYFHQRLIRGVRTPPKPRIHPIAMLEDEQAIQASLMEIINALVRNHIDINRARLILRALFISTKIAGKTHFDLFKNDMVTEVPEYPSAPPTLASFYDAIEQAEALARINEPQPIPEKVDPELILRAVLCRPADLTRAKPPASVQEDLGRTATSTHTG